MGRDPRKTRPYQLARARFLNRPHLTCHWCGRPVSNLHPKDHPLKATVDHLIEVDTSPTLALDTTWWVVACAACNSSRGATYRHRRDNPRPPQPSSRDW